MQLEFLDYDFSEVKKNAIGQPPRAIDSKIDLTNASLAKDILELNFVYSVSYLPDKSTIRIGGRARFSGSGAKAVFAEWRKSRQVTGAEGEYIINTINYSTSTNAMLIARAFNLSPPIIPPIIRLSAAKLKKKK